MRLLLGYIFMSVLACNANSASFDCARAKSRMEKAICSNDELSVLDEKLAASYGDLKIFFSKDFFSKYVKSSQLSWLKATSKSFEESKKIETLKKAYLDRINTLIQGKKSKFGFKLFEGKIDTDNKAILKLQRDARDNPHDQYYWVNLSPLSNDLIFVGSAYNKPSLEDDLVPRCENYNKIFRLSKTKELKSSDLFELSQLDAIASLIYTKNKSDLSDAKKGEVIGNIAIDLESLDNVSIDGSTLTIDYKFGGYSHSCAYVPIQIKINEIKKYLNKDFAKELGF
jgi:uncharacterized protein